MDRAELTELIETRRNQRPDDEITLGHEHKMAFPQGYGGPLRVEYKPGDHLLPEDAFDALAEEGFFAPDMHELEDRPLVEPLVSDLYWALVDVLYPKHSYLDEPWETLPLVVEIEYGRDDVSEYYCSLGTYR